MRGVHWSAFGLAVVLLGWPAFVALDSAYAQWDGERELQQALAASSSQHPTSPQLSPPAEGGQGNEVPPATGEDEPEDVVPERLLTKARRSPDAPSQVLGRFEIPRLGLSYIVLEGTDNRTLDKSIGHIEGTAEIGEKGNIGIAGHRNTHFRKLEWLRRGDEFVLTSTAGTFHYEVEWVKIFSPNEIEVLDPSHGPAVTLVTCFPFEYVGSAPLRYIVRALPSKSAAQGTGNRGSVPVAALDVGRAEDVAR